MRFIVFKRDCRKIKRVRTLKPNRDELPLTDNYIEITNPTEDFLNNWTKGKYELTQDFQNIELVTGWTPPTPPSI